MKAQNDTARDEAWYDVGEAIVLSKLALQQVMVRSHRVALSFREGAFGAISGVCNHVGMGRQDNVQAVAGQRVGFFAELGCTFLHYPYIAHSRGWTAEDMERNVAMVKQSEELALAARELTKRGIDMATRLLASHTPGTVPARCKGRSLPVVRENTR